MQEQEAQFRPEDIEKIRRAVEEKKNAPEFGNLPEIEIVKEAIRPIVRPQSAVKSGAPATSPAVEQIARDNALPSYAKNADEDAQERIERLLSLAFQIGIEKAASEAEKSDPFSLDAFHDALTDKLYQELKKRGML